MFDFLGNIKEQQEELKKALSEIEVSETSSGNELTVVMDGNKRIKDITIDASLLDSDAAERLEDLLVITLNTAMQKVDAHAEEKMREQLGNMLPGGLDQLFGG